MLTVRHCSPAGVSYNIEKPLLKRRDMNVPPDEKLTRFLFSDRLFARTKGEVKYKAFMPDSVDISVYRISGLSDTEVWDTGKKYVERPGRTIKARADLFAAVVYKNDLKVIPDTTPHKLHANITPLPVDIRARERIARRIGSCQQIRNASSVNGLSYTTVGKNVGIEQSSP